MTRDIVSARLPTYFKALVRDARVRRSRTTYWNAGYELGRHIRDYLSEEEYDELMELKSIQELKKWSRLHLRGFLSIVPYARRRIFFEGLGQSLIELQGHRALDLQS